MERKFITTPTTHLPSQSTNIYNHISRHSVALERSTTNRRNSSIIGRRSTTAHRLSIYFLPTFLPSSSDPQKVN